MVSRVEIRFVRLKSGVSARKRHVEGLEGRQLMGLVVLFSTRPSLASTPRVGHSEAPSSCPTLGFSTRGRKRRNFHFKKYGPFT